MSLGTIESWDCVKATPVPPKIILFPGPMVLLIQ
jgi:hypothetical protein